MGSTELGFKVLSTLFFNHETVDSVQN